MLSASNADRTGVGMKRSVQKMIEEFRLYWKHYVLQSLFATVAVFVVLYFLSLQNAVIIASLGASTFIVFAMPDNVTAKPRNVVGMEIDYYSTAPAVSQRGPEVIYELTLTASANLSVLINNLASEGIGNDIHLLASLEIDERRMAADCIAAGDYSVTKELAPGIYYIVIDSGLDMPGEYYAHGILAQHLVHTHPSCVIRPGRKVKKDEDVLRVRVPGQILLEPLHLLLPILITACALPFGGAPLQQLYTTAARKSYEIAQEERTAATLALDNKIVLNLADKFTQDGAIAASAFPSSGPSGRWSGIKGWTGSPGRSIH